MTNKMSWDDVKNEFMVDNAISECSPNDVFDFLKEKYPHGLNIEAFKNVDKSVNDKID